MPKVNYVGVPFIDISQMVISSMVGLEDHRDLTVEDIENLILNKVSPSNDYSEYGSLEWFNEHFEQFKCYSMIYGTNHPRGPSGKLSKDFKKDIFREYILNLVAEVKKQFSQQGEAACEVCGNKYDFNFSEMWKQIDTLTRKKHGLPLQNKEKMIGRDLFPLIGSMSDCSVFGNMSRSFSICPRCLLVPHYLFFQINMVNGKIALVNLADPILHYKIIDSQTKSYINEYITPNPSKDFENRGRKEKNKYGRVFDIVWQYHNEYIETAPNRNEAMKDILEKGMHMTLWLFSNAGQGAELEIKEVPDSLIDFALIIKNLGLETKFKELLDAESAISSEAHIRRKIEAREPYNCKMKNLRKDNDLNKIILLYSIFVLKKPMEYIKKLTELSEAVYRKFSNDDIERGKYDNLTKHLNSVILEKIQNGEINTEFIKEFFGVVPNSKVYNLTRSTIEEFIKFNVTTSTYSELADDLSDTFDENTLFNSSIQELEEPFSKDVLNSYKLIYAKVGKWVLKDIGQQARKQYLERDVFATQKIFIKKMATFALDDPRINWPFFIQLFEWKNSVEDYRRKTVPASHIYSRMKSLLNWYLAAWNKNPTELDTALQEIQDMRISASTITVEEQFDLLLNIVRDYLAYFYENKGRKRTEKVILEMIQGKLRLKNVLKFAIDSQDKIEFDSQITQLDYSDMIQIMDGTSNYEDDYPKSWMHPGETAVLLELGNIFREIQTEVKVKDEALKEDEEIIQDYSILSIDEEIEKESAEIELEEEEDDIDEFDFDLELPDNEDQEISQDSDDREDGDEEEEEIQTKKKEQPKKKTKSTANAKKNPNSENQTKNIKKTRNTNKKSNKTDNKE